MSTGIMQSNAAPNQQSQADPYFKGSLCGSIFYGLLQIMLMIGAIVITAIKSKEMPLLYLTIPGVYLLFMSVQCCIVGRAPIFGLIKQRVHYNAIIPQMRHAIPCVTVRLSNEHQNIDVQTNTKVTQNVNMSQKTSSSSVKSTNSAEVQTKVQSKIVSNNVMIQPANISPFQDCTSPIVHDFSQSNLLICTHQLVTEYTPRNREQIHQQKKFLFNEYHYLDHFAVCTEQISFPQFTPVFIIHDGQQELKWFQKKSSALCMSLIVMSFIPMYKLFKTTQRYHIQLRKVSSEDPVQSRQEIVVPHEGYYGKQSVLQIASVIEPKDTPITMI
ncbi:Hypothetical_protein [Hexamita inflata]|uniref:Hypothetical_protein n=1 Tax=Hexamita inflata TaxID=28002 RepID=A0AA86NLX6_9EUKA|nr:Hypothetical protein HINF_LOCUS8931 [Hexamita inflata]